MHKLICEEFASPETRNPPWGAGHMPAGAGKNDLAIWSSRKSGLSSSWKAISGNGDARPV